MDGLSLNGLIIAEADVVKPSREDQLTLPTDNFTPYSDLERLLNLSWREETTLPPLRIDGRARNSSTLPAGPLLVSVRIWVTHCVARPPRMPIS